MIQIASIVSILLLTATAATSAETITWRNEVVFYGDNTEFFTPYRTGETLLGANLRTFLDVRTGERGRLEVGLFADHRDGADHPLHPVQPLLSYRFEERSWRVIVGTLQTQKRHGFLEPLQQTTLEITRPVEDGLQWMAQTPNSRADLFLNWQRLNTPSSREVFDYGGTATRQIWPLAAGEAQIHGVHHGGQLHDVGPVSNNVAVALGTTIGRPSGRLLASYFHLLSRGEVDLDRPGPVVNGSGDYLRVAFRPRQPYTAFVILWRGRDFVSAEGDANYNSAGRNPSFPGYYRSRREYEELGLMRHARVDGPVQVDVEVRLNRIDTRLEYSYRFVIRVPFEVAVPIRFSSEPR